MIEIPIENVSQVLGCLCKNPNILKNTKEYNLTTSDFEVNAHKIIFSCIYNMYKSGITDNISSIELIEYMKSFNIDWHKMYIEYDNDYSYLENIIKTSNIKNFDYHYTRLKKFVLLKELDLGGWDTRRVYDETNINIELNMSFETKTIEELLNSLFAFNHDLKKKWCSSLDSDSEMTNSREGLRDLIQLFQQGQVFGVKLVNPVLNSIYKGARFGKVILDGASSGSGKTRVAVMNACNMAIPFKYDTQSKKWVTNGLNESVLIISTELQREEVQGMMLATVSKIEENRLNYEYSSLDVEELNRLEKAITLLENYPIQICNLPNYDLNDLELVIEDYIIKYGTRYVFFDYIHMTGKLMEQLKGAREDLIILQIMTAIKNISVKHNCFFWVGSQLNRSVNQAENQDSFAVFRGAFSIGDKVDGGLVTRKTTPDEISDILEKIKGIGGFKKVYRPNLVRTVVKNRGGQNSIKIWVYFNYATLEENVVAVTDLDNNLITIDIIEQDEGTIEDYETYLNWLNS